MWVQLGGGGISARTGSRARGNFTKFGLVTRRISTASSNGLQILYEYNNDRKMSKVYLMLASDLNCFRVESVQ